MRNFLFSCSVPLVLSCGCVQNHCSEPAPPATPVAVHLRTMTIVLERAPAGCCAGVRNALGSLAGVESVEVTAGEQDVRVTYDPNQVTPARLLAELEKSGEAARVKG